jgi:hypothetical protein
MFCPRIFAAISRPSGPMASRSIIIPLVRSVRQLSVRATEYNKWPTPPDTLTDSLWALGLANLAAMRKYDQLVGERAEHAGLANRPLDSWRAILAVALWLQEAHQCDGVFDRLLQLAVAYQSELPNLEVNHELRLLVTGLRDLHDSRNRPNVLRFFTEDLADFVNRQAKVDELCSESTEYMSVRSVGRYLNSLRVDKADSRTQRGWRITGERLLEILPVYGVRPAGVPEGTATTSVGGIAES